MPLLNPFLYGKPVPTTRFVGRENAVRTVFSRVNNGESTAVVGGPHIGKSSLLHYVADPVVRNEWLGPASAADLYSEIDCHMMAHDVTAADFWQDALENVPSAMSDEKVDRQYQVVVEHQFASHSLENLFRAIGTLGRKVVLLIDEFDVLLHHPQLNAEFFGALRSLATRTGGLAVVTASRIAVGAMNRISLDFNPHGSPFFNGFAEERLLPLSPAECRVLVEEALSGTQISFDDADHTYMQDLAGRHPFLVQVAAAGMFEAHVSGSQGHDAYAFAAEFFHDRAAAHFDDAWLSLSPTEQTSLVLLGLGELKGRVDGRIFDTADLGHVEWYGPEIRRLHASGLIELVEHDQSVLGLTLWEGTRWRISSRGFLWWITDNVVAGTRSTIAFDAWLHDKEQEGLLTREQTSRLQGWVNSIPKTAVTSAAQMGKLIATEFIKSTVLHTT